jgi:hypothetical protein
MKLIFGLHVQKTSAHHRTKVLFDKLIFIIIIKLKNFFNKLMCVHLVVITLIITVYFIHFLLFSNR